MENVIPTRKRSALVRKHTRCIVCKSMAKRNTKVFSKIARQESRFFSFYNELLTQSIENLREKKVR